MTEDTPKHRCEWIARDSEGRPRCEHGWAKPQGPGHWACPEKKTARQRRYAATEKAKRLKAAWNTSPEGRESKRRYDLTASRESSKALSTLVHVGRR